MSPNIEISTVIGCRMMCGYCPQRTHISTYAEKSKDTKMSLTTFAKCLDKIPLNVQILFAGMAEPWLNPLATDMLNLAYQLGYQVGVYTTTAGMKKEDVDVLANFTYLHFCLHLPDGNNVMKLKITSEYLDVLGYCNRRIPNTKMCIGTLHPAVEAVVGPVEDSSASLISRAGNLKDRAIEPKKGKLRCSACGPKIDHNILLPNGEVLLCCMDYAQEHVLGNLLECSYDELFTGPAYLNIQAGLLDDTSTILCRKCEISEIYE